MGKVETLETSGSAKGNTKPSRMNPSKYWCFTWNNYPENAVETLETIFEKFQISYLFAKEVGESGTPHLQGYIECPTKIRPIEKLSLDTKIHWEKRKGNRQQNIDYCSKDEGEKYFSKNMKPQRKIKLIDPTYEWELEILKSIDEEPDDRTIYWYWSDEGNVGKTSFCKYLAVKENAMISGGKASDMKNNVVDWMEKFGSTPDLIVVNIPRSKDESFVSYEGIESVKDMLFYSGKYHGGQVVGPCPHMFIFSNFEPDYSKLSSDRWNVTKIVSENGVRGLALPRRASHGGCLRPLFSPSSAARLARRKRVKTEKPEVIDLQTDSE